MNLDAKEDTRDLRSDIYIYGRITDLEVKDVTRKHGAMKRDVV